MEEANKPNLEEMKPEETRSKMNLAVPAFMVVLSVALGMLAFVEYQSSQQQRQLNEALVAQKTELADRINNLEGRSKQLEADAARIDQQTAAGLQDTQKKFSSSAHKLSQQQQETAKKLTSLSDAQGSLSGDLNNVKGDLDKTKEDLGTQSSLIALNHDQLQDLKRRTERDYLEFNLRKAKNYTRVGDLSLQLTKTDVKHQRYNMVVLADDRKIEKKDKTAMEPVQFYMPGDRRLLEVVVWDVSKDHVTGYVSVPKAMMAKSSGE